MRGSNPRRKRQTAAAVEKQAEREQMAYWWARKRAEYEGGAVAQWSETGGSSGSGAWVAGRPSAVVREEVLNCSWSGGVRGEAVHHSVDTRAAWWGDRVTGGDGGGVVLDLEAGRADAESNERAVRARTRRLRRKTRVAADDD